MSITASGMSWAPGRKTRLCCQGKAALPESDPELTAMLSPCRRECQAAVEGSAVARTLKTGRLVPGGASHCSPVSIPSAFLYEGA